MVILDKEEGLTSSSDEAFTVAQNNGLELFSD